MKVLSFAAVGVHGREWLLRVAAAALLAVLAVPLASQSIAPPDLLAELSAKVAAVVASSGASGPPVRTSCGENLREIVCAADIGSGSDRRTVTVTRPRGDTRPAPPSMALALRPLLSQREPMLDVLPIGDELIVLQPGGITERPRVDAGAPPARAAIPTHAWPRDLRGRLRQTALGFDAFLPGVACRGRLKPLAVACADETGGWPIPIENSGIAASRNFFTTPEGFAFYGGASIASTSAARWLVADRGGSLTVLDDRRSAVSRAGTADDLVRVQSACDPGVFVVAAGRAESPGNGVDEVRLLRVTGDTVSVVAKTPLAGGVTALWPTSFDAAATLIVRSVDASRYEAFHVGIACAR